MKFDFFCRWRRLSPLSLLALGALANPAFAAGETAAIPSIAGVYALREVVALQQHVLPKPLPALNMTVTSHGFATIVKTDSGLSITETFCDIALTPRFPVGVTIPEAMVKVIKVTGPLLETEQGGKVLYVREEAPTIVGARLEDPSLDPLPTDPSDPRIWDEDGDGKLGITTFFSGLLKGETHSVRRERYSFQLSPQADGSLRGLMQDRSEEQILEATNDALMRKIEITPHPDASKTYIHLVPLQEEWACEQLMAKKNSLFRG